VTLAPGERHWDIFQRLCREVNAKGNLILMPVWPRSLSRVVQSGLRPIETMPVFPVFDGDIP
jgi:hypothetical protein